MPFHIHFVVAVLAAPGKTFRPRDQFTVGYFIDSYEDSTIQSFTSLTKTDFIDPILTPGKAKEVLFT